MKNCTLHVSSIPKGLRPPAQGCEERATLGKSEGEIVNPNGVAAQGRDEYGHNPVGVGGVPQSFSPGSSFLATLIPYPKLFMAERSGPPKRSVARL